MTEQKWEVDPHNGNKILRDQLRINATTRERVLVDEYLPLHGPRWEVPKRVLADGEPYPLDPAWKPPTDHAQHEREALLADLRAWTKNEGRE